MRSEHCYQEQSSPIRLYETYEDIVEAWNSFMEMPDRIASVAARTGTKVS
jgi:hypothetical protein